MENTFKLACMQAFQRRETSGEAKRGMPACRLHLNKSIKSWLTFNPGLVLISFWTTRPWKWRRLTFHWLRNERSGKWLQVPGSEGGKGHVTCKVVSCFCCFLPLLTFPTTHPKVSMFCLRMYMYSLQASYCNAGSLRRTLGINPLRTCVYIYIRQLSSFRAPMLWLINLTVATCRIQYTFLSLCQFCSWENGQNTTILKVRHFRMIRKCPLTVTRRINTERGSLKCK